MHATQILPFHMERQIPDNWCWAANAASTSRFYTPASTWNQCQIACRSLGRNDCCPPSRPNPCDIPFRLEIALTVTNNFRGLDPRLDPGLIKYEIDRGHVIGIRIRWTNGNGHFVSIFGYTAYTDEFFVHVGDPLYGNSYSTLRDFRLNYQRIGGRWTHTYLTTGPGHAMIEFAQIDEGMLENARSFAPDNLFETNHNLTFINKKGSLEKSDTHTMPHDVYLISFKSLQKGIKPTARLRGVRLLDKGENNENLIYEFDKSRKGAPRQILYSSDFTDDYRRVLTETQESLLKTEETYNVRVVRQPELKVEALWLHVHRKPKRDIFIPVFSNNFLEAGRRYSLNEFFILLRLNVTEKEINTDDMLGG